MTKEVKVEYIPGENSYTIQYYLHGPASTIQFAVRCPTPAWHYYLPISLGFHADKAQYEDQMEFPCNCRPGGKCYFARPTLEAQELWNKVEKQGESVIWSELEKEMEKFNTINSIKIIQLKTPEERETHEVIWRHYLEQVKTQKSDTE